MADTVAVRTLMETKKRLVVRAEITCDGVAVTDAIVVDKSTFTGPNGLEPSKLLIERIDWMADGAQATLEFDHTVDDLICVLGGLTSNSGFYDYTDEGKFHGFVDPASAGVTGDIVVTTAGSTLGDKIGFVLYLVKKD